MKIDSISNLAYFQNVMNTAHTANTRQVSHDQILKTEATTIDNGLTGAERAYFAQLFPGSTGQISSHKTYSPAGINAPVELGQIINRKG